MEQIKFKLTKKDVKVELPERLIFGRNFSTHIFEMDYEPDLGWHNPVIKDFENLQLSPASMVLHYGQAIFEGLKAYHQDSGKIALFRPEKNMERLNNSARRMCIPEIDENFVLEALKELVGIDRDWIPNRPGHSLYIRPLIIATDPFIGVRPSDTYKLLIMLSPVGPCFPEGFKPVSIYATDEYVRAVRKGVGSCKTAGNYAASLAAQRDAIKEGYSQVLWLDAIEQKYVEEVGTMNIFVQFNDEVATPVLTTSILPGITRISVLQILRDWNYNVSERQISMEETIEAYKNGTLKEIFGVGTAAVISSVGKLKYHDFVMNFNEEEAGELGSKLYKEITDIQYGKIEDRYNWMTFID